MTCASSWWLPMRIDGRSPSARLDGVIAGACESSRIIESILRTISVCSDSSGSLIVGIARNLPLRADEAFRLELEPRKRTGRGNIDGAADAQVLVDGGRDALRE